MRVGPVTISGKEVIVRTTNNFITLCPNDLEQELVMKEHQVNGKSISKSMFCFYVGKLEVVS